MKPTKQTVYLPNEKCKILEHSDCPTIIIPNGTILSGEKLFVFTPEQLNEYTASVIKQALENAAEKAEIKERRVTYSSSSGSEYGYVQSINKHSITNTFDETFQKFEV